MHVTLTPISTLPRRVAVGATVMPARLRASLAGVVSRLRALWREHVEFTTPDMVCARCLDDHDFRQCEQALAAWCPECHAVVVTDLRGFRGLDCRHPVDLATITVSHAR